MCSSIPSQVTNMSMDSFETINFDIGLEFDPSFQLAEPSWASQGDESHTTAAELPVDSDTRIAGSYYGNYCVIA